MQILINMQDVQSGIIAAIRTLLLHLCEPIYKLIAFCFEIFENFGKVRLFENSMTISGIYNRIELVLGLFMIFRLTFSAIGYIVNPDNMLNGEKGIGNIVKKVLIMIVLLGSTRYLFDLAYEFNDKLIDSHIVSKIILNKETSKNDSGKDIAWYSFTNFYRLNEEGRARVSGNSADEGKFELCELLLEENGALHKDFYNNSSLKNAEFCLDQLTDNEYQLEGFDDGKEKINIIDFNGLFCLVVGVFLLWTIFTFTLQLGVRVLQLAYLELIAPIPIMMYLMPDGDSKLSAWGKQCLVTFLDFFIRLAIMDFIIIVSTALIDISNSSFLGNFELSNKWQEGYVILIMIIALMIFAKRIPKLLQEILPSASGTGSLGFGFGMPGEAKKVGGFLSSFAGGAIGATAGGLVNGVVGGFDRGRAANILGKNKKFIAGAAATGFFGGLNTGIRNGARKGNVFKNFSSGWAARNKADLEYEKLIAGGGTAMGRFAAGVKSNFGPTPGQDYTRRLGNLSKISSLRSDILKSAENSVEVKALREALMNATQMPGESEQDFIARKNRLYASMINARESFINAAQNGDKKYSYRFANIGTDDDGKIIRDNDGNPIINWTDKTVDINGYKDDLIAVEEVKTGFNDISKTIDSNSIQEWNGSEYKDMIKPSDYESLETTQKNIEATERHIKKDENPAYRPTITNETAAGIDLNQFNTNKPK